MNKRQKEVAQHHLDAEKKVLKELEKQYKTALDDINKKIAILQSDELTQSRIYRLEHQHALKAQVQAVLDKLHSDEYGTISQFLTNTYVDAWVGTAYDLFGWGVPIIMPVDPAEAVKAIQTDSQINGTLYDALGVDVKRLKKSISGEITRGLAGGMSTNEIARNISNATKAPLSRARTIVRTESHRIQQASCYNAQKAAKSKGANVVKQWDSTMDGDTRPTHRQLDGQIREVEEPFEMDGKSAMYPGDFGDPAEDCNCRCQSLQRAKWALDESELQTLKDRAEFFGLDKTEDFEDFRRKYLNAVQESEKQYGVPYGESAIDVDFEKINSREYRQKFVGLTGSKAVDNTVYNTAKKILSHCDGTEHEDIYLINAADGSVFASVTDTPVDRGIIYTDEFLKKLKESAEKKIPIISIHNHPEGYPPSSDDFRKAYDNGYAFGVAVGHNGQVYKYETPTEEITKDLADTMATDIAILSQGGTDVDRASQIVYNSHGLIYTILEGGGA